MFAGGRGRSLIQRENVFFMIVTAWAAFRGLPHLTNEFILRECLEPLEGGFQHDLEMMLL